MIFSPCCSATCSSHIHWTLCWCAWNQSCVTTDRGHTIRLKAGRDADSLQFKGTVAALCCFLFDLFISFSSFNTGLTLQANQLAKPITQIPLYVALVAIKHATVRVSPWGTRQPRGRKKWSPHVKMKLKRWVVLVWTGSKCYPRDYFADTPTNHRPLKKIKKNDEPFFWTALWKNRAIISVSLQRAIIPFNINYTPGIYWIFYITAS